MRSRELTFALLALACFATPARGHEVRPGYLELKQTGEETYDVLWKVPAAGDDMRLGIYVRFPDETVETSEHRGRFVGGAFVERWSVSHPGGLTGQTIHIDGLRSTLTDVLVRFERIAGSVQVVRVIPESPSFVVVSAPSLLAVIATYSGLGVEHILLGIDHLLFVLGLLLIVEGRWLLFKTITAFTVAHSLTLAIATLGYASAPVEPLNAAIALSILFLGPEVVRRWRGQTSLTIRRPWLVAFVFGLLHGFGFASGLADLGVSGGELVLALLMFNVGVEIGQIGFVFLILALVASFRVLLVRWPRWAELAPGYAVGSLGAFWSIQRIAILFGASP